MGASKRSSTHGENVEAKPNGLLMHEDVQLSPEETRVERLLVWKIDLIILPLLLLMYFLAALDRGDVSNAEVAGMGTQLVLTASQYSHCVSFFVIGYIVFQPPGQLLVRKLAVSFERVYGIKPILESRGTLQDLYQSMHQKREQSPMDVYSYMPLFFYYYWVNGQTLLGTDLDNGRYTEVKPISWEGFMTQWRLEAMDTAYLSLSG